MKKIPYHKLVRDKIPTIIKQAGKTYTCRILTDEEYLTCLDEKLNEELAEYQESKSMEELADLLEVIRAITIARGSSPEEIESIRKAKALSRGGFEKRILLETVTEHVKCTPCQGQIFATMDGESATFGRTISLPV